MIACKHGWDVNVEKETDPDFCTLCNLMHMVDVHLEMGWPITPTLKMAIDLDATFPELGYCICGVPGCTAGCRVTTPTSEALIVRDLIQAKLAHLHE